MEFTFPELSNSIRGITIFGSVNPRCENPINTVDHEDFCMHFTKTAQKDAEKHYVFHYSLLRFREGGDHDFSLEENAI